MIKYLNRDTAALILCLAMSLILYFSSSYPVVKSVKAEVSDIISIVTYPQSYYSGLMLIQEENLNMPICKQIYRVLFEKLSAKEKVKDKEK